MANQNSIINLPSLFTGLAQAAAIGTFGLVLTMYVNQSVMKEQQKTTGEKIEKMEDKNDRKNDEQDRRISQLEMILPSQLKEKKRNLDLEE